MCMQIFFPCSKPTPDMSFPLVHIKNFADALRQGRVDLPEISTALSSI